MVDLITHAGGEMDRLTRSDRGSPVSGTLQRRLEISERAKVNARAICGNSAIAKAITFTVVGSGPDFVSSKDPYNDTRGPASLTIVPRSTGTTPLIGSKFSVTPTAIGSVAGMIKCEKKGMWPL